MKGEHNVQLLNNRAHLTTKQETTPNIERRRHGLSGFTQLMLLRNDKFCSYLIFTIT